MRILVVEDDKHVARALKRGLESEGYAVDVALDGTEGHWLATENAYDALVLDCMLPGMSGSELCGSLRDAGNWTPILMLTAKSGVADEAEALDAGADDFLSKPFSYIVLVARLRALLRRGRTERPCILTAGDLRLDPSAHQASRGDTRIELTPRQFSLLEFLMRRAGEVLSKSVIIEHVWTSRSMAIRTSSRSMCVNCGSASTSRSDARASRRCGWWATASIPTAADMRWGSVRTRTTVLAILLVGTTLAAGAILLVITLGQSLSKSGDGLAKSRARDLAGLAEAGALPKVLSKIDGEEIAQVVDTSGRVLASTPNIKDEEAISTLRPPGDKPVVVTITNAPGDDAIEDYRVWALSANTDDGPVSIYVGKSLESVEEATRTLRNSFTVAVPSALALLALGTWLVIGRALRPVEQIREELTTITDEDLDRRVPVPPSDDEVARLAKTMNMVLDRLEAASRKQREFVADASHELQSPLTAIRVQLEVAIAHPEEADWRTLATSVLNDSGQMERLVHDLLYLAREHDQATPASEAVDLDDIVLQEAARTRTTTTILIDTAAVSGAPVFGSRDDLRRLVRNLIENAVHHAGKTVRLTVSRDEQHARVDVEDDGPGVPPEMRDRVFDRFYRTDASRSRHAGGTGLGLAIARTIAERHGGRLELVDSDSGAHFVVTLPVDGSEPRT